MDDQIIHDRIMQILNGRVAMGAGVSAGYGTKAGAKKAQETKLKKKIAVMEKNIKEAKIKLKAEKAKKVKKAPVKAKAKKSPLKVKKVKKAPVKAKAKKRNSNWIDHVKAYQLKHGVSYKEALQEASATYKK